MTQPESFPRSFETPDTKEMAPAEYELRRASDYINVTLDESLEMPRELMLPSGDMINTTVYARITTKDNVGYDVVSSGDHFGVLRDSDEQGSVQSQSLRNENTAYIKDGNGVSVAKIERSHVSTERPDQPAMHIEYLGGDEGAAVRVAVAPEAHAVYANHSEDMKRERIDKRIKRYAKRFGAAVILASTLVSGGLIDKAADGFNKASHTVQDVIPEFAMDSKIDGVIIGDCINADELLDKMNAPREAISLTMDNLDAHNYDAIRARAEAYRVAHQNEFLSTDATAKLMEQLGDAQSVDQVIGAANASLEGLYGVTFGYDESVDAMSVDEARYTMSGIARDLSKLPSSLIREGADLDSVILSTLEEDQNLSHGSKEGTYNGSKGEITIRTHSAVGDAVLGVVGTIPGSQEWSSTFLHELGHALDKKSGINSGSTGVRSSGEYGTVSIVDTAIDFARGGVMMYPEVNSTYARTSQSEHTAESVSGVLDATRSSGLAHPDETRRFNSPANKDMLRTLASLERISPGITDYLVANNDRLMR